MSVWVVCPSKREPAEVEKWAAAWRAQGYKIALWRDCGTTPVLDSSSTGVDALYPRWYQDGLVQYTHEADYPGYAVAVNTLVVKVMEIDQHAEWFVVAGDDIFPDPTKTADEIARDCREHFREHFGVTRREIAEHVKMDANSRFADGTYGVMQPIGDRWGENPNAQDPTQRGAYIDRVAGSAWFGREYCRRINRGRGPLWPEYQHMFVDEEARAVAVKLGVYWERPDLTQYHDHWGRKRGNIEDMPEFLKEANSPEHWKKYKALFEARRNAGFPGSEPL